MRGSVAVRLAALVGITAVWGGTFVMVKNAVSLMPIASFLGYRFLLATIILLPFAGRAHWRGVRAGLPIGAALGLAFIVQTVGLRLTLASDTGLITGLSVVFVPLIEWIVLRVRVGRPTVVALAIAVVGLVLLVGGLPRQLAIGDVIVGVGAVGFAIQIILLSRRSPGHDTLSLTLGLTIGAAAVFVAAALTPMGGGLAFPPAPVWPALIVTATLATSLGFFVQSWAQQKLAATPAAIVLLTEPAWAVFFGVVFSGNPFPPARLLGAALLFLTPVLPTLAGTRPARRILIYMNAARGSAAA
jgi:drug/metabolite transporter (DMT)-like permease